MILILIYLLSLAIVLGICAIEIRKDAVKEPDLTWGDAFDGYLFMLLSAFLPGINSIIALVSLAFMIIERCSRAKWLNKPIFKNPQDK